MLSFQKGAAKGAPKGVADIVVIARRTYLVYRNSLRLGRDELILNKELLAILYNRKLEEVDLVHICDNNPLEINYSIP